MKVFLLLSIVAIIFVSCTKDEVNVKPKACFDYTISSIVTSVDTVKFSNCSSNSDQYKWDFGDGSSSIEKNPMHIFKTKGLFRVKLLAIKDEDSDTISKLINIPYYSDGQIIQLDTILSKKESFYPPITYSLDLEGDGIVDLFINGYSSWSNTVFDGNMKISSNIYEIDQDLYFEKVFYVTPIWNNGELTRFDTIFHSIDTLAIPKIYNIGDIIKHHSASYEKSSLTISDIHQPVTFGGELRNCRIWIKDEIRYIGLQKQYGNTYKIGWLKLKVLDYFNIELISYMIPKATESLTIDQ
jgi:hypothetical protein